MVNPVSHALPIRGTIPNCGTHKGESEMATKPQREARRRYALKKVRELTQASKLTMGDIADVLNDEEIPTPLGTTEWTARLVSALLICDALQYETLDDWLGRSRGKPLLWTLNSADALSFFHFDVTHEPTSIEEIEVLSEFAPGEKLVYERYFWVNVRQLIGAFRALYGELFLTESAHTLELRENVEAGSISADTLVSLPPAAEAYRDYAVAVVKAWCHSTKSYSEVASLLTRRGIPTPDGKTMWRHNQVERLIATSEDQALKQRVSAKTTDMHECLEQMEQSETDDQDDQNVPF
ncbi:MAG: hypothetical protein F4Y42_20930 [Caldilineaceae bacterium SB0664_bin_27]|uniref:Uncharacterized protein n=1 Tax=Caldilineaceae bacterium SB0664_bin_27 TaxID=2605260 RepID=A0A6B0YZK8_9CHLR|nr:hypothetical protein [Caldilineaceae bacterium SB0664_bin_27]